MDPLKEQMKDALEEAMYLAERKCIIAAYPGSYKCTECGEKAEKRSHIEHASACPVRTIEEAIAAAEGCENEGE